MFFLLFASLQVILAQGDDGTFAILIASGCCTVEAPAIRARRMRTATSAMAGPRVDLPRSPHRDQVMGTKVGEVQARGEEIRNHGVNNHHITMVN